MFEPFLLSRSQSNSRVVVICDHARNTVPPELPETLGLPPERMERHIAWDVGAEGVARALAETLDATLVLSTYSRLVIDPNRGLDDPTLMRAIYDGVIIPANLHLDHAEQQRRINTYYRPYHAAIESALNLIKARGEVPIILSIHSYTPQLIGKAPRPWHVGILWDEVDGRLAKPLIASLGADPDIVVGDNEPYSGTFPGDTMASQVYAQGLPGTLLEVRNDLIATPETQRGWGHLLAQHVKPLLEEPETMRIFDRTGGQPHG
ncbi:MAG: N-formylglutamate amidohydrolase [Pseudomonadota bacterium]